MNHSKFTTAPNVKKGVSVITNPSLNKESGPRPMSFIPKINLAKRKAKAAEKGGDEANVPPSEPLKTSSGFSLNPTPFVAGGQAKKEYEIPKKITLDEKGRMIDEHGREIEVEKKISQKRYNHFLAAAAAIDPDHKPKKAVGTRAAADHEGEDYQTQLKKRMYFDSNVEVHAHQAKRRRQLTFAEPEKFMKDGDRMRKQQILRQLESQEQDKLNEMNQEQEVESRIIVKSGELLQNQKEVGDIPQVEWWDQFLLKPEAINSADPGSIDSEKITFYVQHPVPIKSQRTIEIQKMTPSVYLTDKEKKKLSRNRRIKKEKDRQERIRLGLMQAPPPKIKMSNYIQIMAKDAIADPSGTEIVAKAIVEQRQREHFQRNEDRKLTSVQKEEKMSRKHLNDREKECWQALFRINIDLVDQPQNRFKILKNAQQMHLGGILVQADTKLGSSALCTVLLVEGGLRSIKKYKRLLLRRIKWVSPHLPGGQATTEDPAEADDSDEDEEEESVLANQQCFLVWEGTTLAPTFNDRKLKVIQDIRCNADARTAFSEIDCGHFWDQANDFQVGRALGDQDLAKQELQNTLK